MKETQGAIGLLAGPDTATDEGDGDHQDSGSIASEGTEQPKVAFNVGETVKINNGPFLNFSGVIEEDWTRIVAS